MGIPSGLDERDQSWMFDRQRDPHRDRYAEGVLHSVDGPSEVSFARSGTVAPPVRLLTPELLPLWGAPASYSPMLVQRIKEHWLLFTFEHELDPAQRTTLVVDERDGSHTARTTWVRSQCSPSSASWKTTSRSPRVHASHDCRSGPRSSTEHTSAQTGVFADRSTDGGDRETARAGGAQQQHARTCPTE